MNPVKRVLLVLAATAMLLLAFTAVAGAQTANPAYPLTNVGAGGAGRSAGGATGSQLAFTGSNNNTEFAVLGLAAVVVGGGLVVMSRRRRTVAQV